ncbi:hypothetical protein KAFR_0D02360 [Kazachstania africana CBS 2517]|uniref:Uncharacterized protein n=1 Tax=Kazachstania africana (strain ATCC 22294 / BCRC 22015 / CBS 2517 / CECT 1963 / NBRC 1671 / NRRL Y-8276) TaxID=1071382 RepID=H2AU33_KAZAF|nr:hypothetical protein KAFR_0D02360 [Kazachstania africana CBS 2517]CCF57883.1 hypothetical protein KAFR_0D02360 [Kazachstania africana CBS 2517]
MSESKVRTNHVKFDDGMSEDPTITVPEITQKKSTIIAHSDSDSDDEAPEEEGLSQSVTNTRVLAKEREEAIMLEQKLLKERRRQQNEKFREQQEEKRKRLEMKSNEKLDAINTDNADLEKLPEEFFEKLQESEASSKVVESIPKHINFNDISDTNCLPEVKKQLEKKKKKTLKTLRRATLKKGPVHVSVLSSEASVKKLAPVRENSIMRTKDKWLKRSLLRKK